MHVFSLKAETYTTVYMHYIWFFNGDWFCLQNLKETMNMICLEAFRKPIVACILYAGKRMEAATFYCVNFVNDHIGMT